MLVYNQERKLEYLELEPLKSSCLSIVKCSSNNRCVVPETLVWSHIQGVPKVTGSGSGTKSEAAIVLNDPLQVAARGADASDVIFVVVVSVEVVAVEPDDVVVLIVAVSGTH